MKCLKFFLLFLALLNINSESSGVRNSGRHRIVYVDRYRRTENNEFLKLWTIETNFTKLSWSLNFEQSESEIHTRDYIDLIIDKHLHHPITKAIYNHMLQYLCISIMSATSSYKTSELQTYNCKVREHMYDLACGMYDVAAVLRAKSRQRDWSWKWVTRECLQLLSGLSF